MLLSIGIMVKNEEKYLEECLQSLEPIRKEIDSELIIIDTGSDDNTVEIAKKYTNKVYFHEWNEDFSEIRNTIIEKSNGEWYFSIDGDEIIKNPETIINFFKTEKYKKYKTALINIKNYVDIRNNRFTKAMITRLFKNEKNFHYKGAIHEQPQFKKPVARLNTILEHYGYLATDEKLIEYKYTRTKRILEKELDKDPQNIYYWFQLSQTYGMYGDKKKALSTIRKAYNIAKKENIQLKNRMYIYTQLAKQTYVNNYYKESISVCKESFQIKSGYLDIYYYLALSQKKLRNDKKAMKNFEKYLEIYNNFENSVCKKDNSVDNKTISNNQFVYKELIKLYFNNNNYVKVLENMRKVNDEKQFKKIIGLVISSFIELNELKKLVEFYKSLENNPKQKVMTKEFEKIIFSQSYNKEIINKIIYHLSKLESNYGYLNKIRVDMYYDNKKNLSENNLKPTLVNINFDNLPNYYADIIYYCINNQLDVYDVVKPIRENKLNKFIKYLYKKYDDLDSKLLKFIYKNKNVKSIWKLKINKAFCRYILAFNKFENISYRELFHNYIEFGTDYIIKVYSKEILNKELVMEMKNDEEAFLLYIYIANKYKKSNKKLYIKYLRKALKAYPSMKKGIEVLFDEIKDFTKKESQFMKEKNNLKEKINTLIENNQIEKAEKLINSYDDIIENDMEIYSMKSVIAIMRNNLDKAESLLKKSYQINDSDFDTLYNLGYIYIQKEKNNKAYNVLTKAKKLAKTKDLRTEVNELLEKINVKNLNKYNESNKDVKSIESKEVKNNSPIFIGGAGRSGTTLLRVMLNAHKNLCGGPEFKMIPNISKIFRQLDTMKGIKKAYKLNKNSINSNFRSFISGFFEDYISFNNAERIVEKTPHNVLVMKELGEIFPNAKFLHVIRDGRDVACSLVKREWKDFNGKPIWYVQNLENAVKYWKQTIIKGIQDSKADYLKGRVKIVKYEDLVVSPEGNMKDILEFLNEPWDKKVLNHEKVDRGYEPKESSTEQVNKEIYTKSLSRWEREFTKQDKENFKDIAGQLLVDLGYEDDLNW